MTTHDFWIGLGIATCIGIVITILIGVKVEAGTAKLENAIFWACYAVDEYVSEQRQALIKCMPESQGHDLVLYFDRQVNGIQVVMEFSKTNVQTVSGFYMDKDALAKQVVSEIRRL